MGGFAITPPNTSYNLDVTPGTDNNDKATYQQGNTLASAGAGQLSQGAQMTGQGAAAFQQPLSYFSKLLSGSQSDIQAAMAPQVNQLKQGYSQALQSSAELDPRGGGRAAIDANAPYQEAGQVGQMYQGARNNAASSIGPLAQGLTNAGIAQQAQGTGDLSAALAAEYQRRSQNEAETASNKQLASSLASTAAGALI